jgi:hypothetical protein
MDKFNIALLVDMKQEYTIQLIQLLYLQIYTGIKSIYDAAREYCEQSKDNNILKRFQQLLAGVPKWNTDKIQEEFKRIQKNTDCDWLEDLLTAVFVSHTKVLTAIQLKNHNKKTIQLNVPDGPYFIHKCYIETAREFWKRPFLMSHLLSNIDLQRNLAESEKVIKECIHETVRRMLPVRSILKEYLGNDFTDEDINEEDITSNISLTTKNNLRKLVQREIEQTLSKRDDSIIGGDDENTKQVELPTNKKTSQNKKDYTVSKIDNTPDDKLEKELIEAITSNNEVAAENNSNADFTENNTSTITNQPIELSENNNQVIDIPQNTSVINTDDNLITTVNTENNSPSVSVLTTNQNSSNNVDIFTSVSNSENIIKEDKKVEDKNPVPVDIFSVSDNNSDKDIINSNTSDVFTPPPQIDTKISEPIRKDNPMDIFSFFDDAAPYTR